VSDLIEQATSAGEVEETKPAPDPVLSALEKVGCEASEAVMIGDTPYDVAAANQGRRDDHWCSDCGGWSTTGVARSGSGVPGSCRSAAAFRTLAISARLIPALTAGSNPS
jgi:hypothetical protein